MGDFSPAGLRQKDFVVASVGTNAVGWIGVIRQQEVLWLDDLWVEPSWMGKGIGRRLFQQAASLGPPATRTDRSHGPVFGNDA
jgi:GNAT superfamily N-acetyltransferase